MCTTKINLDTIPYDNLLSDQLPWHSSVIEDLVGKEGPFRFGFTIEVYTLQNNIVMTLLADLLRRGVLKDNSDVKIIQIKFKTLPDNWYQVVINISKV